MQYSTAIILTVALGLSHPLAADVAAGKSAYSARGCIACHGANGQSLIATYPSLVGKDAKFIAESLINFRSGRRQNPTMNALAAGLSDADIKNLAHYIDSLSPDQ